MAVQQFGKCCGIACVTKIYPRLFTCLYIRLDRERTCISLTRKKTNPEFNVQCSGFHFFKRGGKAGAGDVDKPLLSFDSSSVTQFSVTNEIQFYRDTKNNFTQTSYSDLSEGYGPPLAIILPWKTLTDNLLKKCIEVYCEKGFDILTVTLNANQFMYPCVAGGAMNVVTDLLEYLNDTHKHRPYIFHGFSVGVYVYGEIMAQFTDHYETYRTISNNVKGCLWDSPVDAICVKSLIGKFFYPKSWFKRWRCNRAVKRHFKLHQHDSVAFWHRSRDNFCSPIINVPQVFFVSCTDPISNPTTLQEVQNTLECNGVQIFQKTWWDSMHTCHFEKYCYEYLYGIVMFLNLSGLCPDENGKYHSGQKPSALTKLRLSKRPRDTVCQ